MGSVLNSFRASVVGGPPPPALGPLSPAPIGKRKKDSNLVDSASSHTLVSKIKPCMSKYARPVQ